MQVADTIGDKQNLRERARTVLMDVLGFPLHEGAPKLKDEDDFYLHGGDSLLAVQAVEGLEQLGFRVHLSTFYESGKIGQILDSLSHPEDIATGLNDLTKKFSKLSKDDEPEDGFDEIHIDVVEWNGSEGDSQANSQPTAETIKKLLTDIFEKKDVVYRALELSRADLECVVNASFMPNEDSIVLLAFCLSPDANRKSTSDSSKLVGILLANRAEPSNNLPPSSPKSGLLMRYLESCYPTSESTAISSEGSTLYVSMVGVLPNSPDEQLCSADSTEARWKRLILEVLSRMEHKVLELAKDKGFVRIDRVNTSEITMKMSVDLGYRLVNETCLKTFAFNEHIEVDPKYHDHHSYYMVKYLNLE